MGETILKGFDRNRVTPKQVKALKLFRLQRFPLHNWVFIFDVLLLILGFVWLEFLGDQKRNEEDSANERHQACQFVHPGYGTNF
jgi:hypothetical protein